MKKDIIKILCCPVCKGKLNLKIDKQENNEIISGFFSCEKCKYNYTIEDGIPNLLPK